MWYFFAGACLIAVLVLRAGKCGRRRAQDALRASRREQQRLVGRLIEAQEAERRRIARELHDDLNQGLALLAVELDALAHRPLGPAAETANRLQELSARVKELSSAVHALSHQLHPSKLEHLGLVGAIRSLCLEVGRHHRLEVNFTYSGVPAVIDPTITLCLFRVAQEAVRNVARHSGAVRADVKLTGTSADLRLAVNDNGVGFDLTAALNGGGLGLVGMRERLCLAGGELTIDSRPAGGTRIDARVPVSKPYHPAPEAVGTASVGGKSVNRAKERQPCSS